MKLKFQTGQKIYQLSAAFGVIVTNLLVDTVSLHFLFSLYICMYFKGLKSTSVYLHV